MCVSFAAVAIVIIQIFKMCQCKCSHNFVVFEETACDSFYFLTTVSKDTINMKDITFLSNLTEGCEYPESDKCILDFYCDGIETICKDPVIKPKNRGTHEVYYETSTFVPTIETTPILYPFINDTIEESLKEDTLDPTKGIHFTNDTKITVDKWDADECDKDDGCLETSTLHPIKDIFINIFHKDNCTENYTKFASDECKEADEFDDHIIALECEIVNFNNCTKDIDKGIPKHVNETFDVTTIKSDIYNETIITTKYSNDTGSDDLNCTRNETDSPDADKCVKNNIKDIVHTNKSLQHENSTKPETTSVPTSTKATTTKPIETKYNTTKKKSSGDKEIITTTAKSELVAIFTTYVPKEVSKRIENAEIAVTTPNINKETQQKIKEEEIEKVLIKNYQQHRDKSRLKNNEVDAAGKVYVAKILVSIISLIASSYLLYLAGRKIKSRLQSGSYNFQYPRDYYYDAENERDSEVTAEMLTSV